MEKTTLEERLKEFVKNKHVSALWQEDFELLTVFIQSELESARNERDNEWYYMLENIIDSDKGFQDKMRMSHAEDYHGLDDDMPDAFDEWYSEQKAADILDMYFTYLEKNRLASKKQ